MAFYINKETYTKGLKLCGTYVYLDSEVLPNHLLQGKTRWKKMTVQKIILIGCLNIMWQVPSKTEAQVEYRPLCVIEW